MSPAPLYITGDVEPWEDHWLEPRKWQIRALPRLLNALDRGVAGVMRVATGGGKSLEIAEVCRMRPDYRIVVTTPTQDLVRQLHATISKRLGEPVGQWYGPTKLVRRVTVCCNASIATLSLEIEPPDLLIADECHKTEAPIYLATLQRWLPKLRLGVTATAYRSDDSERLTLFDDLIFDFGPADAIRASVVVPPIPVTPRPEHGTEINEICAAMIGEQSGPGVVDAANITDAKEFADYLKGSGVAAAVVHSKMDPNTVDRRKRELDAGQLQCLVHVDMLSEGVDMPNLRWICLRRKTGARVRFAQYIGRGLRAVPGKTHCNVLDPWDLFNLHSLDWKACLGADSETEDVGLAALRLADILEDQDLGAGDVEMTLQGVPVVVLDPAASYVRRLRFAMEIFGIIPFDVNPQLWRADDVTTKDLQRIDDRMSIVNRCPDIPREQYRALWIAYRAMRSQKRGTASDLLRVLKAIEWKGWPDILTEVQT